MTTFADTGLNYSTPLTINSRERVVRSETLNLKVQAVSNDSQRWDIVATLEPAVDAGSGDSASAKLAIHRNLNGLTKSFDTRMPQYPGNSVTGSDTLNLFTSGVNAWDTTVEYKKDRVVTRNGAQYRSLADNNQGADPETETDSWEEIPDVNTVGNPFVQISGESITLPAGRFVKLTGHDKVYMIEEEIEFDSPSSLKAVKIFPPLTAAVSGSDDMLYEDFDIKCYYAPDGVEGITVTDGIVTEATVSLVEALT